MVHPEKYLHQLDLMQPTRGRVFTDPDTAMMPDTLRAARLAAGANIQAVDMVMSSQVTNAFVCARPPGHHAERAKSMGFCFYNNVALAAMPSPFIIWSGSRSSISTCTRAMAP